MSFKYKKIDRSLIERVEINIKNWNNNKTDPPNVSGYYRCLIFDLDPTLYVMKILYYNKRPDVTSGGFWSAVQSDIIAYWQELECSSV